MFVDESKKQDYLLVAAVTIPGELALARKTVRGLHKPGQRLLPMVKESPARQHTIMSTLGTLGAQVTIYQAGSGYRTNIERRGACLPSTLSRGDTECRHTLPARRGRTAG